MLIVSATPRARISRFFPPCSYRFTIIELRITTYENQIAPYVLRITFYFLPFVSCFLYPYFGYLFPVPPLHFLQPENRVSF